MAYIKHISEPINDGLLSQPHLLITTVPADELRFSTVQIGAVWEKAKKEFGFFFFKRDHFGKIIAKHEYGKKTQYGWKIVHLKPLAHGGSNEIENLIPVHWENIQP